ncbi:hypothetical protein U5640_22695 [Streptomyces sp. SS7]|uniref:hypothetical protein n=1 Tax=Streptomyces sp. SS7 TaxID=3108485 RepID=UPI0030EBF899
MATVGELSDRYANFLVHPLLPDTGVCRVCRGTATAGYPTCLQCQQASSILGEGVADAVVPVSLALKGEQYANELWRYKNATGPQLQYSAWAWRLSCGVSSPCTRVASRTTAPSLDSAS